MYQFIGAKKLNGIPTFYAELRVFSYLYDYVRLSLPELQEISDYYNKALREICVKEHGKDTALESLFILDRMAIEDQAKKKPEVQGGLVYFAENVLQGIEKEGLDTFIEQHPVDQYIGYIADAYTEKQKLFYDVVGITQNPEDRSYQYHVCFLDSTTRTAEDSGNERDVEVTTLSKKMLCALFHNETLNPDDKKATITLNSKGRPDEHLGNFLNGSKYRQLFELTLDTAPLPDGINLTVEIPGQPIYLSRKSSEFDAFTVDESGMRNLIKSQELIAKAMTTPHWPSIQRQQPGCTHWRTKHNIHKLSGALNDPEGYMKERVANMAPAPAVADGPTGTG